MKSVGWLTMLVGVAGRGSGAAVKVTAPGMGVMAPSSRAFIPRRGSVKVTAT